MTGAQFLNIIVSSSTIHGLADKNSGDNKYRATALEWLNLTLKDIQNRQQQWHWRWLEITKTASTVSGQLDYDPPTDLDSNKIMALYDRTNDITYRFVPYDKFVRLVPNPSVDSGDTVWWTYWAGDIKLYPIPNQAMTFYLDYIKNVSALADDTNTTDVPSKYDQVIIDGAMSYALRFDPELGNWTQQQQLYEAGIARMIQDNNMMINEFMRSESHRDRKRRNLVDGRRSTFFPLSSDNM